MRPAHLFAVTLFLAGATASAQTSPPPRQAPQRPVTSPEPVRNTNLNPDDIITNPLVFAGAEAREVAQTYAELAGKRLIPDMQALGQVSIDVRGKISRGEALRIIEVSLLMNGFTLVHMDDGTIKLLGQTRNPRGYGVPIISDELQIPEGERVITYLFKLRFADPQEVATLLGQYIVPAQSGYNTTPTILAKSQALLLTENSLVIRKILQILKEIDVPPAEAVSEFISLERADAKDVLEKLEKIFEKNQQQQQQQGGGPNVAAGVPRPANRVTTTPEGLPIPGDATVASTGPNSIDISGGLSEESIIIGRIKLTADTRTNRIHIITRPVNLNFIRQLIREFDADVPFGEPASRPLRFVSAGDVFGTVVDAITDPGQKSEGGTSSSGAGPRNSGSTASRNNNLLGNNSRNSGSGLNGSSGGFGGGGLGGGGGTGLSLSESLNTQERDSIPEARVIGNTKIIADKRSNTIIVLGNREVKNKIFALLDKLDVRAPQVMLHTVIGELNLTNNKRLGVNIIANNGSNRGIFGTPTTGTGNGNGNGNGNGGTGGDGTGTGSVASNSGALSLANGVPVLNLANLVGNQNITQILTAGAGGFSGFIAAGNSFAALVDALESNDKFKVVSRPSIFTTNNKKAIIASGEEIAVPVNITGGFSGSNTANNGLVTQSSIQYKTVALQLEVLPLINSDREVTLEITQKIDQQSGSDIIDNNSIPRIATRVLQTTVTVPNEGTLVLGGLIKQTNSKSTSGVPGLSRIPVVGALFRKTTNDKSRTELIILIRPVVTHGPKEDISIREREMEYLQVEPDLEATVYPTNLRGRTTPQELQRRMPLKLRETGPSLRTETTTTTTTFSDGK